MKTPVLQLQRMGTLRTRDNGCPWDEKTCSQAAARGHLATPRWARANGYPWNGKTSWCAAHEGQLAALEWCTTNGYPCDRTMVEGSRINKHHHVVAWIRDDVCCDSGGDLEEQEFDGSSEMHGDY